ncbi:MAG TPA: putative glycolipid-binding domain-containing protein [Longimicrobiaceae bacterium]|nr:putative glycolipid-binding domain-containing protein [Longimicrobiaceae bacterium]
MILWRALGWPGHDAARLERRGARWRLRGTAVLAQEGQPCRLDYYVVCDDAWRTRSARVAGWVGGEPVRIEISADAAGIWRLNGAECPAVEGCTDVDLAFTPATNLLPIRRLALAVGGEAPVRAAWLRFPELTLEPLEQVYRRTGERVYRYESGGGTFTADLQVNEAGFVTLYPGLWRAEAQIPSPEP